MRHIVVVDQSEGSSLSGFNAIGPFASEETADGIMNDITRFAEEGLYSINRILVMQIDESGEIGHFLKELILEGGYAEDIEDVSDTVLVREVHRRGLSVGPLNAGRGTGDGSVT